MEMYKTVDSTKLFTTTFTPDKFTHLFSSSQANVRSPHRSLLWERIVIIGHGFDDVFFTAERCREKGWGLWDTLHTISALDLGYARTPIYPIWVPGRHGIMVSQYQSWNRSSVNEQTPLPPVSEFFSVLYFTCDSIKSFCIDLDYIGQV